MLDKQEDKANKEMQAVFEEYAKRQKQQTKRMDLQYRTLKKNI